jgi:hypothetical protein
LSFTYRDFTSKVLAKNCCISLGQHDWPFGIQGDLLKVPIPFTVKFGSKFRNSILKGICHSTKLVCFARVEQFKTSENSEGDRRHGNKEAVPPGMSPKEISNGRVQEDANKDQIYNYAYRQGSSHASILPSTLCLSSKASGRF